MQTEEEKNPFFLLLLLVSLQFRWCRCYCVCLCEMMYVCLWHSRKLKFWQTFYSLLFFSFSSILSLSLFLFFSFFLFNSVEFNSQKSLNQTKVNCLHNSPIRTSIYLLLAKSSYRSVLLLLFFAILHFWRIKRMDT